MASSSSSSSSSSNFFPPIPPPLDDQNYTPTPLIITSEEIKTFHKIDRTLFSRLVFALGRDISVSLHVMAFLLWLEHCGQARHLVAYLISLPDSFINTLADEVGLCLTCMNTANFAVFAANFGNDSFFDVIPLIKRLTKSQLTLRYIHDNREIILQAIRQNMKDVCIRAFDDICEKAERYNKEKSIIDEERMKMEEEMNRMTISRAVDATVANKSHSHGLKGGGESEGESSEAALQTQVASDDPKGSSTETPKVVNTTSGGSGVRGSSRGVQEEKVVPADDRTIFLTFSKGYPISETEVLDFFTRRFGEVIEAIHLQEVVAGEQPLYARMVLRSPATIPVMLHRRLKNKFTINGKHVWARKYVRKTPRVNN